MEILALSALAEDCGWACEDASQLSCMYIVELACLREHLL